MEEDFLSALAAYIPQDAREAEAVSYTHLMRATLMAAGEVVYQDALFDTLKEKACIVKPFPLGEEAGRQAAKALVEKYHPTAMIFVERLGPNEAGIYHFVSGTVSSPEQMSYGHFLVEEAKKHGILTIGIGDGGNEIGFGKIVEQVRELSLIHIFQIQYKEIGVNLEIEMFANYYHYDVIFQGDYDIGLEHFGWNEPILTLNMVFTDPQNLIACGQEASFYDTVALASHTPDSKAPTALILSLIHI